MKLTLFTEELRECLNAARFSDCGENDSWNYWYQRVLKAHNDAVERQIATEQAENAKLRELVSLYHYGATHEASPSDVLAWSTKVDSLRRELRIEADE